MLPIIVLPLFYLARSRSLKLLSSSVHFLLAYRLLAFNALHLPFAYFPSILTLTNQSLNLSRTTWPNTGYFVIVYLFSPNVYKCFSLVQFPHSPPTSQRTVCQHFTTLSQEARSRDFWFKFFQKHENWHTCPL